MAKIKYEEIIFRTKAVALLATIDKVLAKYVSKGYTITLRQLYYHLVSHDLFPDEQKFRNVGGDKWVRDLVHGTKNATPNYDWLGVVVSNGRRAGLIDWDVIVDRTRFLRRPSTWETPGGIIKATAQQFEVDRWRDQGSYIEVWFEKDALLSVFERATEIRQLPIFSNRGYNSDSAVWEAAQRFSERTQGGRQGIVLHFGDHDPSGIDMSRDIEERLNLFGAEPRVRRLALNMNQVEQYNPPPNPAKEKDSRYADYVAKYGDESWELDALEPEVMVALVENYVRRYIDVPKWKAALRREEKGRAELKLVGDNYLVALAAALRASMK